MAKRKRLRSSEWRERATASVHLLTGCVRLTVALALLVQTVRHWPL